MNEEKYVGTKFNTIFLNKQVPKSKRIEELIYWGEKFYKMGLSKPYEGGGSTGNLSFRVKSGFIIKGSYTNLGKMRKEDLVKVIKCKGLNVYVIGKKEPSSETLLHHAIYKKRSEINAIFHLHDYLVMKAGKKLHIVETKRYQPYGTLELVKEVMKILDKNNYIILKNGGIVALGKTIKEAGERVLETHKNAKKILISKALL